MYAASLNLEELQVESEIGVRGDIRHSLLAIGEMRWDDNATFATNLHAGNTNIPAGDDRTITKLEFESWAFLVCYRSVSSAFEKEREMLRTIKNLAVC